MRIVLIFFMYMSLTSCDIFKSKEIENNVKNSGGCEMFDILEKDDISNFIISSVINIFEKNNTLETSILTKDGRNAYPKNGSKIPFFYDFKYKIENNTAINGMVLNNDSGEWNQALIFLNNGEYLDFKINDINKLGFIKEEDAILDNSNIRLFYSAFGFNENVIESKALNYIQQEKIYKRYSFKNNIKKICFYLFTDEKGSFISNEYILKIKRIYFFKCN